MGRNIIPDDIYGDETAKGVMKLQESFGGIEIDGNFGPETREAWKSFLDIDIDAIPTNAFEGETISVGP